VSRLLGLDLGRRRIGIAVADEDGRGARPLSTVARGRDVVGLPLSLDGTVGPQAAETQAWATRLAALTGLRVSLRDERLTTTRATERVGPAQRGAAGGPPSRERRRARSARLDREAATLILQAELDARRAAPS
jgi:putative Holliday junction resolvase